MERLRNEVNAGRVKNPKQLRAALRKSLVELLAPIAKPLQMPAFVKPFILFVAGVNGVGKTTTIGKLAARYKGERSEEHTSELQSLMRISYAVFCLKKKNTQHETSKK